ncbi:MAG: BBE domain-containing protein [Actinomycetota bacterium]|nr:BBE domain-containing protein [Actinomycetota bacterium]
MPHELNVNAVWLPHEPLGDAETAWARAFIGALEPHHAGVYVNFLDRDDLDRSAEAFGAAAYECLLALQHQFDPDQVFKPRHRAEPIPADPEGASSVV